MNYALVCSQRSESVGRFSVIVEEQTMKISTQELGDAIQKVVLRGSLDVAGAAEADGPLADVSAANDKVIVDMTAVEFLASVGIRILVRSAKSIAGRGGKFAIFGTNETAKRVMWTTGLDSIITMVDSEADAVAAVS